MTAPAPGLPLTGERTVPGVAHENYWFRRHEVAYAFVAPLVAGRTVVEVGCGEGYGTDRLAAAGAEVVGVDYDASTVAHAARSYAAPAFVRANLAALPVRSQSVDAVVTLQVIEHVWHHGQFLAECHRILRADGLLAVSTPNRLTFSPGRDAPTNPFHTREFTADELVELIGGHGFRVEQLLGVHAGTRLAELDRSHGGSFVDAQLTTPHDRWGDRLRIEVAAIGVEDFGVLAADVHSVDHSLDLLVLARRSGA